MLFSAYINIFVCFLINLFIFNWRRVFYSYWTTWPKLFHMHPFVKFFLYLCHFSGTADTHKQKNYPTHNFQILTQNGS